MNTFKKTGGFTLVELIIVIAILAILSSVAVAGYSTYIKKANDSAVETFMNDLKNHAALANAKGGAVTKIEIDVDGTVKVTFDAVATDFVDNFDEAYGIEVKAADKTATTVVFELGDMLPDNWTNSSYGTAKGAEWNNNEWTAKEITGVAVATTTTEETE